MGAPDDILERLSAYRDGELDAAERARVEKALAESPALQARLADLEAVSANVRLTLERAADEVDFSGFADRVLARTAPKPSLAERLRVAWQEWREHRPLPLFVGAAAAVLLIAGGPLWLVATGTPGAGGGSGGAQVATSPEPSTNPGRPVAGPRPAQGGKLGGAAPAAVASTARARATVRSVKTAPDKEPILTQADDGTAVIFLRSK